MTLTSDTLLARLDALGARSKEVPPSREETVALLELLAPEHWHPPDLVALQEELVEVLPISNSAGFYTFLHRACAHSRDHTLDFAESDAAAGAEKAASENKAHAAALLRYASLLKRLPGAYSAAATLLALAPAADLPLLGEALPKLAPPVQGLVLTALAERVHDSAAAAVLRDFIDTQDPSGSASISERERKGHAVGIAYRSLRAIEESEREEAKKMLATMDRKAPAEERRDITKEVIQRAPELIWAHGELARAYFDLEQYEAALAACAAGLEIDERSGHCRIVQAETLIALGRLEEATQAYISATKAHAGHTYLSAAIARGLPKLQTEELKPLRTLLLRELFLLHRNVSLPKELESPEVEAARHFATSEQTRAERARLRFGSGVLAQAWAALHDAEALPFAPEHLPHLMKFAGFDRSSLCDADLDILDKLLPELFANLAFDGAAEEVLQSLLNAEVGRRARPTLNRCITTVLEVPGLTEDGRQALEKRLPKQTFEGTAGLLELAAGKGRPIPPDCVLPALDRIRMHPRLRRAVDALLPEADEATLTQALSTAAAEGALEMVDALLAAGADPSKGQGKTPAQFAAEGAAFGWLGQAAVIGRLGPVDTNAGWIDDCKAPIRAALRGDIPDLADPTADIDRLCGHLASRGADAALADALFTRILSGETTGEQRLLLIKAFESWAAVWPDEAIAAIFAAIDAGDRKDRRLLTELLFHCCADANSRSLGDVDLAPSVGKSIVPKVDLLLSWSAEEESEYQASKLLQGISKLPLSDAQKARLWSAIDSHVERFDKVPRWLLYATPGAEAQAAPVLLRLLSTRTKDGDFQSVTHALARVPFALLKPHAAPLNESVLGRVAATSMPAQDGRHAGIRLLSRLKRLSENP